MGELNTWRPREMQTQIHTKTCTCAFVAAIFTTANMQKPPKRASTEGRMNELCSLHTLDISQCAKEDTLIMLRMGDLENMLSERCQFQRPQIL